MTASVRAGIMVLPIVVGLACASLERPDVDDETLARYVGNMRQETRERLHSAHLRVQRVAHRLSIAGRVLCEDKVGPVLGAGIARRKDFVGGGKDREVEETFGVGKEVTVFAVVEGSMAERAGLRRGDKILAVDGSRTNRTQDVFEQLRRSKGRTSTLRVERSGAIHERELSRSEGCAQGFLVFVGSGVDTLQHNNRKEIEVPTGLLDFARNDDELAIALSHQLAHQVRGGGMIHAEEEPPADRLGLFLAAQAGYDVRKAPGFWDRLAAEEPWKISDDMEDGRNVHAAMALRAPVIRATVTEIQRRLSAGEPLVPAKEQ